MFTWSDFVGLARSRFFCATRERGEYRCGNDESFYLKGADPEKASYDTGNNKAITRSGLNGELQALTIFKESYFADNIPGVWVHKGRILAGPFAFSLKLDGREIRLPDFEGAIRTDLVECAIPLTSYALDDLVAEVAAFAPISCDGERPRGAFYVLALTNTGAERRAGEVLPPSMGHFHDIMERGDMAQIRIRMADTGESAQRVAFELRPGETRLFPVWMSVYGEDGDVPDAMRWLERTLGYYRKLSGALRFPDDPFLTEFMARQLQQCQQCIGMDEQGDIAGSSWGTNPTTHQIWMKDMYYSMLPLAQADPALFQAGVRWFAKWGVRPKGTLFPGGVAHSLSNSLSAVMMAAQYYRATGDLSLFRDGELVRRLCDILDEMLMSREGERWLFPSVWISDGLCMGDFHTGSNITAFAALNGFADVLEALGEARRAADYRGVAGKVREAILTECVTPDGPFGPQLTEGVGKGSEQMQRRMAAGSLQEFREKNSGFGVQFYEFYNHADGEPYLVHDGEETDTTLAAFYGLTAFDEPLVRNYARFAMTEHNRFFCPVSGGILWEDCTDSTFPGYVTGMSNAVDPEGYRAHFSRIRQLCDLDGSIWWWPYPHGAQDNSLMRRDPGKCGWAAGALMALIRHDLMGVNYDGAARKLTLRPLDSLGRFAWQDAPLGGARFDIECDGTSACVTNRMTFAVELDVQLFGQSLSVNGRDIGAQPAAYFGRPARRAAIRLLPGECARVCAR